MSAPIALQSNHNISACLTIAMMDWKTSVRENTSWLKRGMSYSVRMERGTRDGKSLFDHLMDEKNKRKC